MITWCQSTGTLRIFGVLTILVACTDGVGYPLRRQPAEPQADAAGNGGAPSIPDAGAAGSGTITDCMPVREECSSDNAAFRSVNPSFEIPPLDLINFNYVHAANVPGWDTNDPQNMIEIWQSGYEGVLSADASKHVEISASVRGILGQEVASVPSSELRWGFHHRGRHGTDTMELWIGSPGGLTLERSFSTSPEAWALYEGVYQVPEGQTQTRFEYRAILPDSSSGNFLDNAYIEPVCTCLDAGTPEPTAEP